MTARTDLDQAMLDYFEGRSTTSAPDGLLETAMASVGSTRQRPAWRTSDWWLPSVWADRVTWQTRRVALVGAVGLLIAILVALAILSGAGHRLPPPFGPARPGAIVIEAGGDIYLADADGENRTKLYAGPHWDGHATFSPDGTKIAFESALEDKSKALMVMQADGTGPQTLMGGMADVDDVIAWSPDSRRVAIGARPLPDPRSPMFPYSDSRIVVGEVEHGTGSFVGGSDLFGQYPQWSPDGTMLAFGRCCSEEQDGVWLMRPDGSDLHALSTEHGGGAPAWSPDGTKIAFLGAGVDGDSDLYLVGADGSHQDRVTDDTGNESIPVWSPDSTKVGFSRMLNSGNEGELKILDVITGQVTTLEGAHVTHDPPVWSPDGKHLLAYVFTRPDNPDHVSGYDTLGIFDVTNGSMPVRIPVAGLRFASWQRLAP